MGDELPYFDLLLIPKKAMLVGNPSMNEHPSKWIEMLLVTSCQCNMDKLRQFETLRPNQDFLAGLLFGSSV